MRNRTKIMYIILFEGYCVDTINLILNVMDIQE